MSEINTLMFEVFHISGAKNCLSDCGSLFPTGAADTDKSGNNEGTNSRQEKRAADKIGGYECTSSRHENAVNECKVAQVFAYGANCPVFDADQQVDNTDNYICQAMNEVASVLSLAAGRNISFAMTIEKLQREILLDDEYKYLRKVVTENVPVVFVGRLAK